MSIARRALLVLLLGLIAPSASWADQPVNLLDLVSTVPDAWMPETPKSEMRRLQFAVPAQGGEGAEFVVFYFGPGQGGTLDANLERWQSQFKGPDGTPVEPVVSPIETGSMPAVLVELRGSYGRSVGMGQGDEVLDDRMLLAAIVETPQGNLYPQLHGPAALVSAHRDGFIAFLQGIRAVGENANP
jgi:hypothetical protein